MTGFKGMVTINVNDLLNKDTSTDQWLPLQKRKDKDKVKGEIRIVISTEFFLQSDNLNIGESFEEGQSLHLVRKRENEGYVVMVTKSDRCSYYKEAITTENTPSVRNIYFL